MWGRGWGRSLASASLGTGILGLPEPWGGRLSPHRASVTGCGSGCPFVSAFSQATTLPPCAPTSPG